MNKFSGIPSGKLEYTPLPNLFFSELLPAIDNLAELRVTLHIFYLLYHKKTSPRFVTASELSADRTLMNALGGEDALAQGLAKAVERGTLLLRLSEGQDLYFFNTEESRRLLEKIARGEVQVRAEIPPQSGETKRANIFETYEKHIGVLTPIISEELKQAEKEYPPDWIEDAFRIAVENNVRKWSYVRAILEDWTREGKNETSGRNSKKRTWYSKDEAKFFKR